MIDTHCHLTFPDFEANLPEILTECAAAGVTGLITICTTTHNAPEVLALAKLHPQVWCSAGVHPLYADQDPHDWNLLRACMAHPRCVAWGELGLDNHYPQPAPAIQRAVLEAHLACIDSHRKQGNDKPIILHCREAFSDLLPILRATGFPPERFVFHCFTGNESDMRAILDFGAMVSFTGVVTYPSATDLRRAALLPPLDRIMVETDAPFLSPIPHRGKRPCRPAWVRHTAQALAQLRGEPFDHFHHAINRNTQRFFGIPAPTPHPTPTAGGAP